MSMLEHLTTTKTNLTDEQMLSLLFRGKLRKVNFGMLSEQQQLLLPVIRQ